MFRVHIQRGIEDSYTTLEVEGLGQMIECFNVNIQFNITNWELLAEIEGTGTNDYWNMYKLCANQHEAREISYEALRL